MEYGGYHTIILDKSVALKKGERFAVTEFVKGRDGYFINIESGFDKDVSELYGLPYKQDVVIEPGQSYLLQEEEGTGEIVAEDIYEIPGVNGMKFGNAEIKVFTADQETVPELMLNMNCFDAEGRLIDSSRLLSDHTQIRLSSDTESVSFEKAGQNGEGSYQLSLGGEPYTEGTLISKEDLKGGLEISLVSAPRGNADAKIGYQFVTETVPEKEPSENEDGDKTPGTTDQPEDNTGGDQKEPGKHPSDELSDNKNPGMSEGSGADQTAQDKLKKDTSPRTDDYGNKPALWGCITAAAALGAAVIIRKKKYYS